MLDSEEVKNYYSEWWENPKDIRNIIARYGSIIAGLDVCGTKWTMLRK